MTTPPEGDPYRTYFERSPLGVFVADENGDYVDVNEMGCELVGYSRAELLERSVSDLVEDTPAGGLPPAFQDLKAAGRYESELKLHHADGHLIDVRVDAVAIDGGQYVAYVRDVTERKERERHIIELKERFELAVEGAKLGVWDWSLETGIVEVNESWAEMLGDSPTDVRTDHGEWESRLHPEDEKRVLEALQAHLAGETEYYEAEYRIRTADESWKWIRDLGQVIERDEDGEARRAVGIHQDIEERRQAEAALENARDRLRQIIDLVPDLIFVKNRAAEYQLANEAVADAFGLSVEEILGRSDFELLDKQDPDTFHTDDMDVIESGERKVIEEETFLTADGEKRIYNTVKMPYKLAGTDELAVLGYARDITGLKEYERTLEAQRDNLEVLNQTVRHDIRNDLQLVVAYADLLEDYVEAAGQSHLDQVRNAARNAVHITETARTVADVVLRADEDLQTVDLRPVLEGEVEAARSNHDRVVVTVPDPIPAVRVRADDLLDSVFRNLLQNAVVHNDSPVPAVTVTASKTDTQAVITIADDGPGVPDEEKATIFEEGVHGLESTGTGLGLYIVETLVDRYGGRVTVGDNEPRGAVFTVRLPLAEPEEE